MSDPIPLGEAIDEAIDAIKQRAKEHGMSLTDDEVIATENDAEMMRRPHLWHHHSLLPLKRSTPSELQVAVLAITPEGKYRVLENMSLFGPLGRPVIVHLYDEPEDALMHGWVVD